MKRRFELMVDSSSEDEPEPRRFGSLEAALTSFEELDSQWQRFAWIREHDAPGDRRGVIHMRDGVRI